MQLACQPSPRMRCAASFPRRTLTWSSRWPSAGSNSTRLLLRGPLRPLRRSMGCGRLLVILTPVPRSQAILPSVLCHPTTHFHPTRRASRIDRATTCFCSTSPSVRCTPVWYPCGCPRSPLRSMPLRGRWQPKPMRSPTSLSACGRTRSRSCSSAHCCSSCSCTWSRCPRRRPSASTAPTTPSRARPSTRATPRG